MNEIQFQAQQDFSATATRPIMVTPNILSNGQQGSFLRSKVAGA
jgi:hypothetical protein